MANRPSPNSLIHCAECGEDYSATYKRCPFCGAKNEPSQPDSGRQSSSSDLEDTYVFDGQDLFDDEPDEGASPAYAKGGKRLAEKPFSNPFANADINWPRVITFICSLIIIVAAMVIVFTVVYPQLRGNKDPVASNTGSPPPAASDPVSGSSESPDPGVSDPVPGTTDPGVEPTTDVPPVDTNRLKGFTTNIYGRDEEGFTLEEGGSWAMKLTFDPADWSGEVTYSISDTRYATVSASGNVVNVNPDRALHRVILTITAGGITLEMPVYCHGATAAPSGSDRTGTVVDAENGLNVRSGPNTTYEKIGSLPNGTVVTILETLESGWHRISYIGASGIATEGYVSGDYISIN